MAATGKYFSFKIYILKLSPQEINYRSYCSKYKKSLRLPRTDFPHKIKPHCRRERDHHIEKQAKFEELYSSQKKFTKTSFILHDGPPYANGSVHIGHAVNKILKDITIRNQLLNGKQIHFNPGWDCHGLPIELKVLKETGYLSNYEFELSIRKKAHFFSQKTKNDQMVSFKEWGLLADWKNSYITCDSNYVIQQLKLFQELYDKGIIFRDYKPVFWSPVNRTSLAEAELDYCSNHISSSVYIKFNISRCPDLLKHTLVPNTQLYVVVWTTTPWSLPANQAVCFASGKKYCVAFCKGRNECYLTAEETVSSLEIALNTSLQVLKTFEGPLLKDVTYYHPFMKDRECPLLPAHHVTMEKGTGLVHMAPNHGMDDFIVAKKQALSIDPCLVDDKGFYTADAGKDLVGKDVLGLGNAYILSKLKKDILHLEKYVHRYPYDWRSKTPVIIKSSHQWFIDVHQIREKAITCLQDVNVIPKHLKKVFLNQLESAPQWCISRQRSWGVPIPAFYNLDHKPIIHRLLTENLCSLIKSHGIHCWWELNLEQLFPPSIKNQLNLKDISYQKGSDIMDIWLDSGLSWRCALPDPYISDMCIEGLDQIRGWFYSSLITSVAIRGKAPYKSIVLHGFITDAEGRKMSKSEGNVVSSSDILLGSKNDGILPYGIDVLRWWVAAHACHSENTPIKNQILEECSQNINKLRNTFKFLLGSLETFDNFDDVDRISVSEMRALDLFMLHKVLQFSLTIEEHYKAVQYKTVTKEILNFVSNYVSSFYCALIKDRLYCDHVNSKGRQHSQIVLNLILNALVQSITPICPHLASEVLLYHPDKNIAEKNVFFSQFPCLKDVLFGTSLPFSVEIASEMRNTLMKSEIKSSNTSISIKCSSSVSTYLQELFFNSDDHSGLNEFFQASEVSINEFPLDTSESETLSGKIEKLGEDGEFSILVTKSKSAKCPRCRLFKSYSPQSSLCKRCDTVINYHNSVQAVNKTL